MMESNWVKLYCTNVNSVIFGFMKTTNLSSPARLTLDGCHALNDVKVWWLHVLKIVKVSDYSLESFFFAHSSGVCMVVPCIFCICLSLSVYYLTLLFFL